MADAVARRDIHISVKHPQRQCSIAAHEIHVQPISRATLGPSYGIVDSFKAFPVDPTRTAIEILLTLCSYPDDHFTGTIQYRLKTDHVYH
jgi:hypothetical protein